MKRIIGFFLAMLLLISCNQDQSDLDDVLLESQSNNEVIKFLKEIDNKSIVWEVPQEVLVLIHKNLIKNNRLDDANSLKNTYDFSTGKLTNIANILMENNPDLYNNLSTSNGYMDYQAHMAGIGWMPWVSSDTNEFSGYLGKRLEAIKFSGAAPYAHSAFKARAHVKGIGWMPYANAMQIIGTTGQGRRMEAIQIQSTHSLIPIYRSYVRGIGWMSYVSNGNVSGTTGQRKQMEAFQLYFYNY